MRIFLEFSNYFIRTISNEFWRTDDIKSTFHPYQFVVIDHYSTFESILRKNVYYSELINSFWGNNSIKFLFDYVLKPHRIIQKEIDQFKKKNGLYNHQVIAMQIRRGTKETSFVEIADLKMEMMFYTCAKKLAKSDDVLIIYFYFFLFFFLLLFHYFYFKVYFLSLFLNYHFLLFYFYIIIFCLFLYYFYYFIYNKLINQK